MWVDDDDPADDPEIDWYINRLFAVCGVVALLMLVAHPVAAWFWSFLQYAIPHQ